MSKNRTKWLTTNEPYWINKWDVLLKKTPQGNFSQMSTWLKSYIPYGFQPEIMIYADEFDNIIAGSGNVIVRIPFFTIYVCSHGPIILKEDDQLIEDFISEFIKRSKSLHAIAAQITFSDIIRPKHISNNFCKGNIFPKISAISQVSTIELLTNDDSTFNAEAVVNSFLPKGRRDVRASYRKCLISRIAKTEDEIKEAYLCFIQNSENKGYNVRAWDDIKLSLIESICLNHALIVTAFCEDEIQGAILLYIGGDTINYTMGGVYRHKPDLLTGYFLQFEAMKIAHSLGISRYNITSGGPSEVRDFKLKFNPLLHEFPGSYYFENSKFKCRLFVLIYKFLKTKITFVIKILHLLK